MNYIFDFDGTLADSFAAMIAVYNKNIRDNKDPLGPDEIQKLRGMSSRKAIKSIGLRWWQVPRLILKGLPDFKALVPSLETFKDLTEILKQLQVRDDRLYIVTSNTRDSVDKFLELHKMTDYFIDIQAGAGLFNKAKYIRKLMKSYGMKRKQTVYVGDETRDIQAARLAFVKAVSVTWGFNTAKALKKMRPNYIADEPSDLLDIKL